MSTNCPILTGKEDRGILVYTGWGGCWVGGTDRWKAAVGETSMDKEI